MFEIQKELVLSPEVVEVVFKVIAKLTSEQPKVHAAIPTIPEETAEEAKEAL